MYEDTKTVRDLIQSPILTPVTKNNSPIHTFGWIPLANGVSMTSLNVHAH